MDLGKSIKDLDMAALTLQQIKTTLKNVDRKVDKLLFAPLKTALNFYHTALNEILTQKFELASKTFEEVIKKATEGLNNIEEVNGSINVETFKQCMIAIKLIASSKIEHYSYCHKEVTILPYFNLDKDTKELIARELEALVQRGISLKDNVKTKKFGFSRKDKEKKAEDTLDSVLKVCYPFLSEGFGWTKMASKLASPTVSLHLMPKYLPVGEEDETCVKIGVNNGKVVRIYIWREDRLVKIKYEQRMVLETSIQSDDKVKLEIDLEVNIQSCLINIELKGQLATAYQRLSGSYRVNTKKLKKKGIKEFKNEWNRLLYVYENKWCVGERVGESGKLRGVWRSEAPDCPAKETLWNWFNTNDVWASVPDSEFSISCRFHK